jgi:taurine dioxygenase
MAAKLAKNSTSGPGSKQGYQAIKVRPITGILGAEIESVDLSKPDEKVRAEIRQALAEYLVLIFRDQELTNDQYKDFARSLGGPLTSTPFSKGEDAEGILHTLAVDGYENHGRTNYIAHIDESMNEIPNKYTLLYALEVPEAGGDTEFFSLYAAYDALSKPMQNFLSGLTSLHGIIACSEWDRIIAGQSADVLTKRASRYTDRLVTHPLVTTIPETGRKQIFYNPNRSVHIPELNLEESRLTLQFLRNHVLQSDFSCRVRYQLKTVCLWDNRCTLHRAMTDFWAGRRRMLRIETTDDRRPA